jgi:type III secretion system YscQ/HrcQ family protein
MAVAERLESYRQTGLPLANWFAAAFPAVGQVEKWLTEVASAMLQHPGNVRAKLIRGNFVEANKKAGDLVLDSDGLTFGRDETNRVVLPEQTITRHHARLTLQDSRVLIEDLDSALGTMVNGRRIDPFSPAELADGDEFVIFPHRFTAHISREWVPAGAVQIGQPFQCQGNGAEFHATIPARWSVFALTVEPVGAVFSLIADDPFLEGLCAAALAPIEATNAGLTPGKEAVIELLLLSAIERANRDLAMPFQFSLGRRGAQPAITGDGYAIGAALKIDRLAGAVRLFLPYTALEKMRAAWTGPSPVAPAELGWRFALSAGAVELNAAEYAGLEPGDVILYHSAPAVLYPGRDDQGWNASLTDEGHYKLEKRIAMETVTPLDELPLRLHIVIDEKELTWAEVSRLAPGAILDLQRDPRDAVKLAVNGRLLGTGELVEIEGRLGVKLLTWGRA